MEESKFYSTSGKIYGPGAAYKYASLYEKSACVEESPLIIRADGMPKENRSNFIAALFRPRGVWKSAAAIATR
jgi:hypothetical protein